MQRNLESNEWNSQAVITKDLIHRLSERLPSKCKPSQQSNVRSMSHVAYSTETPSVP
jgi:hypothetical protein